MSNSETGPPSHIETFKAHAKGSGWPTAVDISDSEWRFQVDEPIEDGGSNSGPNPMHHFVASLAGCQNEQAQVVAEELGLNANSVTLSVEVDLNLAGFMGEADNSDGCFKAVRLSGAVKGLTDEEASKLGERIDARCPILSVLRTSGTHISSKWLGA
jgi:uncharacterized OsmC-like protein